MDNKLSMMKYSILAFIFTFGYTIAVCQNIHYVDSIKNTMKREQRDTALADKLQDISDYYKNFNRDSTVFFGQQALTLANEIGYYNGKIRSLEAMGLTYRGTGDIPTGLDFFFQGLQFAEDNNDEYAGARFLINIGHIYRDLEDYDNAMDYYKRANEITQAEHDEATSGFLLWNIGNINKKLNHPDSALFYKRKAYDKLKLSKLHNGYEFMMMGDMEFEFGNHSLAFDYLRKSIEVSRRLKIGFHEVFAYITIAEFFRDLNQPDSCIYYAMKGLAFARVGSFQIKILEASKILSALYESRDIKEALHYRKIADSAYENLFGARKVQNLQKIVTREQERQRRIETENIAYQNKLKQYALMAGLIIFSFIAFILYRNNKNKQKVNKAMAATLSDLKATQSQLIQSEKMASLGELTAGIAHEIQNPLNFVNNFSEVNAELIEELKEERKKEIRDFANEDDILNDIKENEQKISHHGKRADSIVKGMLQHSRKSTGEKELTDINALADEYLHLTYHGMRARDKSFNATIRTDFDNSIGKININPQDIGRVLLNLYNNAFYAVNLKNKSAFDKAIAGLYEPTVSISTKKMGDNVEITVSDNGNGIPEKILDKIFQPFFTTKPTGQGTGLGLSLAYDIVKAHGGEIRVETKDNGGTMFIIHLPIF